MVNGINVSGYVVINVDDIIYVIFDKHQYVEVGDTFAVVGRYESDINIYPISSPVIVELVSRFVVYINHQIDIKIRNVSIMHGSVTLRGNKFMLEVNVNNERVTFMYAMAVHVYDLHTHKRYRADRTIHIHENSKCIRSSYQMNTALMYLMRGEYTRNDNAEFNTRAYDIMKYRQRVIPEMRNYADIDIIVFN